MPSAAFARPRPPRRRRARGEAGTPAATSASTTRSSRARASAASISVARGRRDARRGPGSCGSADRRPAARAPPRSRSQKRLSLPATIISEPSPSRTPRRARSAGTRCPRGPATPPVPSSRRAGTRAATAPSRTATPRSSRRSPRSSAREDADGRPQPGREVDERDADAHRGPSGSPVTLMIPRAACRSGS